tara:strand:- start:5236 stop:6144 length:909 start_codon:yes stop_codon:yes gene_type:complete
MALISIITPTYNRAKEIERLYKSLKSQTLQDFKWIIVDDGSNDNTFEVIKNFKDKRIKYIWQENKGVNFARNRGDQEIKKEYVIYLDSDDILFENTTLEFMYKEIKNSGDEIGRVDLNVVNFSKEENMKIKHNRLIVNYEDAICEKKIHGEVFSIYKSETIKFSNWPDIDGMEAIRHWRILKYKTALFINKPGRIYFDQTNVKRLSNPKGLIKRAKSLKKGCDILIREHLENWKLLCPAQIGKYNYNKVLYSLLSDDYVDVFNSVRLAIIYGEYKIKFKTIMLCILFVCPLALRRKIFIFLR